MNKRTWLTLAFSLVLSGFLLIISDRGEGQAAPGRAKQTAITVLGDQTLFVDRSGSIAAGATSQPLAAANSLRKRIIIQNPCTATSQGIAASENLFINFTSAATISGGNSIELQPCGSFDSGLGPVSTEAITVIATTISHKYVVKEM